MELFQKQWKCYFDAFFLHPHHFFHCKYHNVSRATNKSCQYIAELADLINEKQPCKKQICLLIWQVGLLKWKKNKQTNKQKQKQKQRHGLLHAVYMHLSR